MPLNSPTPSYDRPNRGPGDVPLRMYLEANSVRVYLPPQVEFFDAGLLAPWPEYPVPSYTRRGSDEGMVAGLQGTQILAGRTIHQDYGAHESSGTVEITLPLVDLDFLETLQAFAALVNPTMFWSPDDGANEWRVLFQPGQSFTPTPIAGFPGLFRLVVKLRVVLKSV